MTSKIKGMLPGEVPVYAARMRGKVIKGLYIVNNRLYLGRRIKNWNRLPGFVLKEPTLFNRTIVRLKIYWARLTCW